MPICLHSPGHRAAARKRIGRRLLAGVVMPAGLLLSVGVGVMASPGVASASPCSDTWTNTAGGNWDTGTNWSLGAKPGSSDVACITAAGSYTVVLGNEAVNVVGLTIGGTGSTPTLQVGNGGAGTPSIDASSLISNAGTFSFGWGGTLTTPSLTNTGTFEVPSTSFNTTFDLGGVVNQGAFDVNAANNVFSLTTSSSHFDNTSSGTINVGAGDALPVTSPSGQAGTVVQDGLITNSGSFTVIDGFEVSGGSICGNAVSVGIDGQGPTSLTFDATVGTGPTCSGGAKQDKLFMANATSTLTGNIPKGYTVTIGDGGSSFAHVTVSGALTNSGTLIPGFGATLTATSPLTNKGTLEVPTSTFLTTFNLAGLVNKKAIEVNGPSSLSLTTSSSQLDNDSTGTITIASGASLPVTSPSGQTGSVVQDGLITNSGTFSVVDTFEVKGGSICGNTIAVGIDGGSPANLTFDATVGTGPACTGGAKQDQLFMANTTSTLTGNIPTAYTVTIGDGGSSFAHIALPAAMTNAGTLIPGFGATLTSTGTLTNTGSLEVPTNGFSTVLNLGGLLNQGTFSTKGMLTVNLPSGDSVSNASTGKIKVSASTLQVTGGLANDGGITIKAGARLDMTTTYSQTATASLKVIISGSSTFGQLNATGTASLAGKLTVATKNYTPPHGQTFLVLTSGGLGGTTFTSVVGPFTLTYTATNVTAVAN